MRILVEAQTMRTKIGRNDPCHCGSGKKYKRCHLALDEQEESGSSPNPPTISQSDATRWHAAKEGEAETGMTGRASTVDDSSDASELAPRPLGIGRIASLLRALSRKGPKSERAEFQRDREEILRLRQRHRERTEHGKCQGPSCRGVHVHNLPWNQTH